MKNRIRSTTLAVLIAAGGLFSATASTVAQQDYPNRPITMIVPFSAGGGTDLGARLVANDLEAILGVNVVVENRAGAGSQIGLAALAAAEPDGYTIGAVNQPALDTIIHSPEREATFSIESFEYIINHVAEPIIIGVAPDSSYETLSDLIEGAQASGQFHVATSGLLTPEHLAQLQFEQEADTRLRIAHFNGAAESMAQFLGGRSDIAFTTAAYLEGVRPLAILSEERLPSLPDVPTAIEQGYPGLVMVSTRGFAVPTGIDPEILQTLRDAFAEVGMSPDHQERAANSNLNLSIIVGDEYEALVRSIHETAGELVQFAQQRE